MLLINSGFEADWGAEESHRCLVIPADGSPYEQDIGNIFTPPDWLTFFYHDPGTWDQPEVRDAWRDDDERRAHSGEKGILLFTFSRKHVAGFLQQVQVEPGTRLRLSAWAHAWSNHRDPSQPDRFPHPDNGWWSEGAGWAPRNERHEYDGSKNWYLQGEIANAEWKNFTFKVAIDPTGGINPFADTVVYGQGIHIYNEYVQVPAVEAVAQADTVTVFLRSVTRWPFKHNDAYWDDASLEAVDELPSGECPGQPRVQYKRTYVLMPLSADADDVKAAVDATWNETRYTFGGSADDAGMGNLGPIGDDVSGHKRVLAVRPDEWSDDLAAFFEEHYNDPPIEYVPIPGNDFQVDGRLRAVTLRDAGVILTYPTTHMPPRITGEFGVDRGTYIHNGLDMAAQPPDEILAALPGTVRVAGINAAEPWYGWQVRVESVINGEQILTRYAHMMENGIVVQVGDDVVTGQSLGTADNTGDSTGHHLHIDVKWDGAYVDPAMLIDWPPDEPPPPPPPPPLPELGDPISVHVQQPTADPSGYGDVQFVQDVKPEVVKLVFHMQHGRLYKQVSPNTKVIYRHWVAHQGEFWENPDLQQGAREFLYTFLDSLNAERDYIDYVEGLNEIGIACGNPDGIRRHVEFECWFAEALAEEGMPAKPCLLAVAVGNPEHGAEVELLLPAAQKVVEYDGALNYHGYQRVLNKDPRWDEDWYHYAGRALESWDPFFRSQGVYPKYILGEAGAFADAVAGWKHSTCFDGDWMAYEEMLLEFRRRINEWNAQHGNRCLGATLFTYLRSDDWKYYNLYGYLHQLAGGLTGNGQDTNVLLSFVKRIFGR